jgi:hypothetical protein
VTDWEPKENLILKFSNLIENFENNSKANKAKLQLQKAAHDKEASSTPLDGFGRGLEAERILGRTDGDTSTALYLVKWKGDEKPSFVQVERGNLLCPQVVIKFFEERCVWGRNGD